MKLQTLFAALGLCAFAGMAQAHMVWLERDGQGETRAYFGEWPDDLRETRDGYLKMLDGSQAVLAGKKLDGKQNPDNLSFATQGKGDVRLTKATVYGDSRAVFVAKVGREETKAASDFELVPQSAGSNTFTLLFEGKPLAEAEVTAFSPQKWGKGFHTDEKGQVTLVLPWKGQYVLEVAHSVEGKGELDGKAYEKSRFVHTLNFTAE
ncbi:DUF4198 domain-containing protein [Pseudomonas sp. LRF_L74]|uniref:DUF4198 domain-containing protein n=1 Tax=Pseudomonas sp. LRF_L74 TaxID=3369422 RepID=UPI003F619F3E